jgi:hypothetical protein
MDTTIKAALSLVIPLATLVFVGVGLFGLIKGQLPLAGKSKLEGIGARIAGIVLIIGALLCCSIASVVLNAK